MPPGASSFGGGNVSSIAFTSSFERDLKKYKKRDPELYSDILQAVEDLQKNPRPGSIRFEKIKSVGLYTIHVRGNVKISMDLNGEHATLRRVADHDTIDTSP